MAPDSGRFRALVVDDEPVAREAVHTLLREEPAIEVVGEAASGDEAVKGARRLRPDLLFLDVQMPGRDGFQVLEALGPDVPRGVVFVTAFDEHALRAFDVHALDYVVKPFGRPRFAAAVARAVARLRGEDAASLRRTLAALVRSQRPAAETGSLALDAPGAPAHPERLAVRIGSRIVLVPVAEIDWIESDGDYVRLHAGETAHFVAARTQALERLLDPRRFLRIHRSVIVNLERVRELLRDEDGGGAVRLGDGVRLRVARARWDSLERALGIG
jgi:two-component system LytT family response regulator